MKLNMKINNELISILERLKELILMPATHTNVMWSHFNSEEEVIDELNVHVGRLQAKNFKK